MDISQALDFKNRNQWRKWLSKNHSSEKSVVLVIYKKHMKGKGLTLEEAVEESLCFGWIDSQIKSIDGDRFIQRYSQRSDKSVWSKINREKAESLIASGKMTEAGMQKIRIAKENSSWDGAYTSKERMELPEDLKKALMKNKKAWDNFDNFANTYWNMYGGWVVEAKQEKTRKNRIKKVVEYASKNQKLFNM